MVFQLKNGSNLLVETINYKTRGGKDELYLRMQVNCVGVILEQVKEHLKSDDLITIKKLQNDCF